MADAVRMLKQVGEHFKRKYGLAYEFGPHFMTDAPKGQIDILDLFKSKEVQQFAKGVVNYFDKAN